MKGKNKGEGKKRRSVCFLLFVFLFFSASAQYSPKDIKYSVTDLYALRYYPFRVPADSIVRAVMDRTGAGAFVAAPAVYRKTAVDLVFHTAFLDNRRQHLSRTDNLFYRNFIKPYEPWLQYTRPLNESGRETALTIGLYEEQAKDGVLSVSKSEGIYDCIGIQNVGDVLDKTFGDIDLLRDQSESMRFPFRSPLVSGNSARYRYFLSSIQQEDGRAVYEIAFYPADPKDNHALTGYLYVTADGCYSLVRALFTLNIPYSINLIKNVLFVQTFTGAAEPFRPLRKETLFTWGDEMAGSLLINRTAHYLHPVELQEAEKLSGDVVALAAQTGAFQNLQTGVHFLLTDHLTVGGKNGWFEYGPVLQSLSYNEVEGVRLRVGGNTTLRLNRRLLLGGFVAYGTKDRRLKYRGDVIFSFSPKNKDIWEFPKRLFQVSYVQDFNNPGDDLLTSRRDHVLYSFSHARIFNLSFQRMAVVRYTHELPNQLSFKVEGKYLHDRPEGGLSILRALTGSEVNFALRYAPREIFLQNRESRMYLRKNIEWNLSHRIGLKNVFGSEYAYHITRFDAYRKFYFPQNVGQAEVRLAAGHVWSRIPFPLLFITKGNQSYIFQKDDYNLADYYEFITDRFVSGNVGIRFNWSPFRLFYDSRVKTSLGGRVLYGPLSDNNNPSLHFELYPFPPEVQRLGSRPYVEVNIGFSDILKVLRVEWVHRLTYREPKIVGERKKTGSLFITTSFDF
jgi:hypothetical protein